MEPLRIVGRCRNCEQWRIKQEWGEWHLAVGHCKLTGNLTQAMDRCFEYKHVKRRKKKKK